MPSEATSRNDADESLASKVLLSADLRGVDSHGIARLSGYVRLWEANRINATHNRLIWQYHGNLLHVMQQMQAWHQKFFYLQIYVE